MQRRVQNAEGESRRIGYKDTDTTIASKDVSFRHMILNRTTLIGATERKATSTNTKYYEYKNS